MYRGVPESGRKCFEKVLPAGAGAKIYFSSAEPRGERFFVWAVKNF